MFFHNDTLHSESSPAYEIQLTIYPGLIRPELSLNAAEPLHFYDFVLCWPLLYRYIILKRLGWFILMSRLYPAERVRDYAIERNTS